MGSSPAAAEQPPCCSAPTVPSGVASSAWRRLRRTAGPTQEPSDTKRALLRPYLATRLVSALLCCDWNSPGSVGKSRFSPSGARLALCRLGVPNGSVWEQTGTTDSTKEGLEHKKGRWTPSPALTAEVTAELRPKFSTSAWTLLPSLRL